MWFSLIVSFFIHHTTEHFKNYLADFFLFPPTPLPPLAEDRFSKKTLAEDHLSKKKLNGKSAKLFQNFLS